MKLHEICRKSAWLSGLAAVLVMAGCASAPPVPPSDTLAGAPSSQPAAARAATPATPPPAPILVAQKYVVKRGDTLSGIASANDCSVADLRTWNKLDGRGKLRMGQVLRIVRLQPLQAPTASVGAQVAANGSTGAGQTSASTASDRQVVKETKRHAGGVALRWPAQGKIVDAFRPGRTAASRSPAARATRSARRPTAA